MTDDISDRDLLKIFVGFLLAYRQDFALHSYRVQFTPGGDAMSIDDVLDIAAEQVGANVAHDEGMKNHDRR